MKKILVLSVLILGGCLEPKEHLSDLHYYKDQRTGLCFAGMYVGANSSMWTNVPCTPEVEKVAEPFISK